MKVNSHFPVWNNEITAGNEGLKIKSIDNSQQQPNIFASVKKLEAQAELVIRFV